MWACDVDGCTKQFAREADLKRHRKTTRAHSIASFACPHCNATFTRADAQRRHQKSRHSDDLPAEPPSSKDPPAKPSPKAKPPAMSCPPEPRPVGTGNNNYYRAHTAEITPNPEVTERALSVAPGQSSSSNPHYTPSPHYRQPTTEPKPETRKSRRTRSSAKASALGSGSGATSISTTARRNAAKSKRGSSVPVPSLPPLSATSTTVTAVSASASTSGSTSLSESSPRPSPSPISPLRVHHPQENNFNGILHASSSSSNQNSSSNSNLPIIIDPSVTLPINPDLGSIEEEIDLLAHTNMNNGSLIGSSMPLSMEYSSKYSPFHHQQRGHHLPPGMDVMLVDVDSISDGHDPEDDMADLNSDSVTQWGEVKGKEGLNGDVNGARDRDRSVMPGGPGDGLLRDYSGSLQPDTTIDQLFGHDGESMLHSDFLLENPIYDPGPT
ncbi:hypothetical protein CC1G_00633 [Coprinopsis cinerea okayama7|uniref:C2H2-type domain-containing protein n=1 Tax=Coprinopsis cinerea (strain Okayama-7 / 130 / ATCC MYA-4618 / FGSC 9003) TaxID=240176 RepID=A8N3L4_COPC7|nr:hypothetical protein CC1G_00633 [Coprinopsis cinerea okayama7\|eukprot:XP_001829454.2 hypothetical protein CC1G_00633 [Coprinopsis cinerea okayama7\